MVQGLLQDRIKPLTRSAVANVLTIDLEDYFMVSAFEAFVRKSEWPSRPSRVVQNTERILDILDENSVKATFFTLGWIAEHFPALVRSVADRGHEIACHSFEHRMLYNMTPEEFRADVRRAKAILEDVSGTEVIGFRAPSFSLTPETRWALDILRTEGFKYDSSMMPAPHARGGFPGASRYPFEIDGLIELPMSTLTAVGKTLPFSGGGYFRLFPYPLVRYGVQACNRDGQPAVIYVHPWEFDPEQPRLNGRFVDRLKHYVNLDKTERKFRRLLADFTFDTARAVLTKSAGLQR